MTDFAGWFGLRPKDSEAARIRADMLAGVPEHPAAEEHLLGGEHYQLFGRGPNPWLDSADEPECQVLLSGDCWWSGVRSLDGRAAAAKRLAAGYLATGIEALRHLRGHFAVAIVDRLRRRLYLATDRMGTRPLYCYPSGDGLLFATRSGCLRRYPGGPTALSRQAVYDYLYFHMIPAPLSVWEGVERLVPGAWISFEAGKIGRGRYHSHEFHESGESFDQLKQSCHRVLDDCIRPYAGLSDTGVFLSGGLDSSTVAGKFRAATARQVDTFTIGFDSEGYDESEYARTSARHFETRHHEFFVTPQDVIDSAEVLGDAFDEPFGNSSAVPTYHCARMAADQGVRTMLAGDGGDELFAGNARYAKQWQFSWFDRLPGAAAGALQRLARGSALEALTPLRKLRSYVRQASLPMPERMESYNLLRRIGAGQVMGEALLAAVDESHPESLQCAVWAEHADAGLVNGMLAYDWRFTLADNDLVKVSRACDAAGVTAVYPLLQDPLVEFANSLAPGVKLRRTRLRHFYRESMRGFLHPATLDKSKHGFGLPFGVWVWQHQIVRDFVRDHLNDLGKRGLVRGEFIDKLIDHYLPQHPAFYGGFSWILVMLEQWFVRHQPAQSRPASRASA